jgi:tetratricopeptide (TPR) repeat protein
VGPWRSWERACLAGRRSGVRIPSAPPSKFAREMTRLGDVADRPAPQTRDDDLIGVVREAREHIFVIRADHEQWLSRLEERHDPLHKLVENLLTTDPQTAAELAAVLWRFWWQRGHMVEGRTFLERAARVDSPELEEVQKGLGTIAFRQGDVEVAEQAFLKRLELAQRHGDQRKLADAFADLSRISLRRGDFAAVRAYAERGYAAASGLEPEAIRMPLHMRAAAARMGGHLDEARELYLESRELNERLGNLGNVAGEDHNLIYIALHSGDRNEAERRFRASSDWIFANHNAYLRPYSFLDAGVLALHDGDLERAGRLVAVAQRIFEETESIPDPDDRVELDNTVARLQEELGNRFGAVWAEGRKLTVEEARALARG